MLGNPRSTRDDVEPRYKFLEVGDSSRCGERL